MATTWEEIRAVAEAYSSGSLGASSGGTVLHGADSAVARPDTPDPVTWVGSVIPDNMLDGDLYLDTDAQATIITPPKLIVPQSSGGTVLTDTAWYAQYGTIFHRFDVPIGGTYRYVNFRIGSASGNVHVAVVALSGGGLLNYTRVAHSGVVACPTAGNIRGSGTVADLGNFDLDSGPHALAFWADNTTLTVPQGISTNQAAIPTAATATLTSAGIPASGSVSAWGSTRRLYGINLEANV